MVQFNTNRIEDRLSAVLRTLSKENQVLTIVERLI